MAKGLGKRKETKKPKKEVAKVIAAAPSSKNPVSSAVAKPKG